MTHPPFLGYFNDRGDYVAPDGSIITAEDMGREPQYPYGPDAWITESTPTGLGDAFARRFYRPRRDQAFEVRADHVYPTAAQFKDAWEIAGHKTRYARGRPLPPGYSHGGNQVTKRKPTRLRIASLTAVGLGFVAAMLCVGSWGVALILDRPEAWAASLWFLMSALAFEVLAFILQLINGEQS